MRAGNSIAGPRWLAVFLALALSLLCLPSTASAADTTAVSISAPSEPLEAGEQFSISIEVAPGTPIAGMQFDLSFDPSLVAVSTVEEGGLLNQGGATSFFNSGSVDNQAGRVTGVFGAITTPGMTVSMPGTFATVILTARQQSESCRLSLSNVIVGDMGGNAVPVSFDNHGSPSAAVQRPVFRWWVLSVIVGAAIVLIAVTVAGILLRRRQIMRALEAPSTSTPNGRN
jgi:Cohesin domain